MLTSIGLSKPFYAKYNANGGTPSYSGGKSMGMATEFSMDVSGADPAILYADNGAAEAVNTFGSGSATYGVHRLTLATLADLLGQTLQENGGVDFQADASSPYLGTAVISQDIADGKISYTVILLYKVKFQQPNIARVTRGDAVEYQVPSLTATIMRDDSSKSKWMHLENFASEEAALGYIKTALNIPESEIAAARGLEWNSAGAL